MEIRRLFSLLFLIAFCSLASAGIIERSESESLLRVKRQWGQMPWQQQQWNNQRNQQNIAAKQSKYNCQTQGINLIGLPISSYNCQNSGMAADVNMNSQSSQQQGMMQGPLGGFLNGFMGRK